MPRSMPPEPPPSHRTVSEAATSAALGRARRFLLDQRLESGGFRFGPHHDVERWPSMVLPGTYNSVMALQLLGHAFEPDERDRLVAVLRSYQRPDGRFRMPQMTPDAVFKRADPQETWGYLDFHVTNYALGALEALEGLEPGDVAFVRPFLETAHLEAWLGRRDLRDPWLEGNNLVNLGSFLFLTATGGDPNDRGPARTALGTLMAWHDRYQDPTTGFWGPLQHRGPRELLHAMAGATHDYHLYYALGRPVPAVDRAVDYVLSLPPDLVSACIDVDAIDILVHAAHMPGYRRHGIEAWCAAWLLRAIADQQDDGGFCDEREGVLRFDGWVGGYWEPQGLSNTFATYFRCIAIALCASLLWPGQHRFGFRRMPGIGYARLESGAPTTEGLATWTS